MDKGLISGKDWDFFLPFLMLLLHCDTVVCGQISLHIYELSSLYT